MLDEIVAAAKRLCHGEHAQLYLADGDVFVVFSQSDDSPAGYEYAEDHPHARDRTTVVGRVALTGEAVQIPDVLADAEYSFGGQSIAGYRALLGVPIVLDDELIGAIAVGRNVPGPFADEHVELVTTFADQAAIAIANARLIDAVERQRTELSRFVSPAVAALDLLEGRRAAARRPPRVHLLLLLRPPRLHGVRRDRGAGRDDRGAPQVPRDARRADPRLRRDARALRGGRRDGVLQRPPPRRGPRAPGHPARDRRAGAVRGVGAEGGASVARNSGWGSGSRRGTRRSAGSASRAATTTERSGR